ncbi:MAG: hypothetical protein OJF49_000223 [Ktedonobacterales bacterium]|nr:MAG: hypothetical protein OJF49_000223 [Ktedonobacterales bacterium]
MLRFQRSTYMQEASEKHEIVWMAHNGAEYRCICDAGMGIGRRWDERAVKGV